MRQVIIRLITLLLSLLYGMPNGFCSNVAVSNITLGALSGGSTTVTFNISWSVSWRSATVISNWDAAWVFVKFRKNGGNWTHASLNSSGHSMPSGATYTAGLVDTGAAFSISTNPVCGVFIYRSADGVGAFTANGIGLSWNYSQDGVTSGDTVEIRVFAIEMVYVPSGSFFAGDNATSTNSFKQGSSDDDPWWISSEDAITTTSSAGTGTNVAETAAEYYYPGGGDAAGSVFTIPSAFPKGHQGFYIMKGELSQGQWVTFFNTLTATQKSTRDITSATGKNTDSLSYRNNVSWGGSGDATLPDQGGGATYEAVGMSYLSWADLTAYLDWAGLRPMSELEFEKAGRGVQRAVSGEYAWGDTSLTQATSISDGGLSTERAQSGSNAAYGNHASVQGPLRVGSFSYGVATRIASGAGYYGAMELSGNLWERPVTLGNSTGRSFSGRYHGNGALDANGDPNVSTWPGTGAVGIGLRGGGWLDTVTYSRLSDRGSAVSTDTARYMNVGGRGVRSAPNDPYYQNVSILLHFDGTNNSTTFTDSAPSPNSLTVNADTKISTAQSKFGGASGYFDGTGDYLLGPANNGYGFGTNDFTVEFFVRFNSVGQQSLIDSATSLTHTGTSDWGIEYTGSTNKLTFFKHWGGYTPVYGSWTPSANTWHHVAVTRERGTVRMFVDGTELSTTGATNFNGFSFTSTGLKIGLLPYNTGLAGYLDELRITNNVARYSSNFSVPSAAFPSN